VTRDTGGAQCVHTADLRNKVTHAAKAGRRYRYYVLTPPCDRNPRE
jgi:hypothetical protein